MATNSPVFSLNTIQRRKKVKSLYPGLVCLDNHPVYRCRRGHYNQFRWAHQQSTVRYRYSREGV